MCVYIYIYLCVCVCVFICIYIYVYIYICVCVSIYIYMYICVCVCVYIFMCVCIYIYIYIYVFWPQFFVNTNFIKHNRHFLSTYFLLDAFLFPYCFYLIQRELIYVLSIVVCIPSTSVRLWAIIRG